MTENPFKSGHTMCTFGVKSNDRRGVGLPLMKGQSVKSQARFVESKGSIPRACSPTSMSRQSTPAPRDSESPAPDGQSLEQPAETLQAGPQLTEPDYDSKCRDLKRKVEDIEAVRPLYLVENIV